VVLQDAVGMNVKFALDNGFLTDKLVPQYLN
jgi:hypothetical protein